MKKEKRNILPGAALAALAAAIIVYCIMLNVEKNAMTAYEKGTVLVASSDIAGGTVFTAENMDSYITEKELDKSMIPKAAITQRELLEQQMAVGNLNQGAVITEAMLTDLDQVLKEMREPVMAGFKADDLYQVVSGTLRNGDRIHIYTVEPETGNTYLIWDNIFVREVFDGSGAAIAPEDTVTAAQRVNILMEKESIEQFYSELATGSLRVVKVLD